MGNATIRVTFGDSAAGDAHLSAEIDSRPTGLNGGKTGFVGGDDVFILLYRSDNVEILRADSTAGSIGLYPAQPSVTLTKTEEFVLEEEDTFELPVPAESVVSAVWYGRDLGAPVLQPNKMTMRVPIRGLGLVKVTFTARADVYVLHSPTAINGETDFSIAALIVGGVTE